MQRNASQKKKKKEKRKLSRVCFTWRGISVILLLRFSDCKKLTTEKSGERMRQAANSRDSRLIRTIRVWFMVFHEGFLERGHHHGVGWSHSSRSGGNRPYEIEMRRDWFYVSFHTWSESRELTRKQRNRRRFEYFSYTISTCCVLRSSGRTNEDAPRNFCFSGKTAGNVSNSLLGNQ